MSPMKSPALALSLPEPISVGVDEEVATTSRPFGVGSSVAIVVLTVTHLGLSDADIRIQIVAISRLQSGEVAFLLAQAGLRLVVA